MIGLNSISLWELSAFLIAVFVDMLIPCQQSCAIIFYGTYQGFEMRLHHIYIRKRHGLDSMLGQQAP